MQKEFSKWGGVDPHEKAIVEGKIKKIKKPIYHYTYKDFDHQIECLNKHSTLSAKCYFKEGKKPKLINIFVNPISRFFKFYILKKGYREGMPGLIVAILESYYTFNKYIKLWELEKRNK